MVERPWRLPHHTKVVEANDQAIATVKNGSRGVTEYYGGDLLHTMAISGRCRVRTELLHVVVVPSTPPHPSPGGSFIIMAAM